MILRPVKLEDSLRDMFEDYLSDYTSEDLFEDLGIDPSEAFVKLYFAGMIDEDDLSRLFDFDSDTDEGLEE